jgi:hypothetical protein
VSSRLAVSGPVKDWRADCRKARVSLAPRGYGRTSYHLSEIVQLVSFTTHSLVLKKTKNIFRLCALR